MLPIDIPGQELWDSVHEEFITTKPVHLVLEHSLLSVSKWESIHEKAFLKEAPPKTIDEMKDYIRCMTITQNVDPNVYKFIPNSVIKQVDEYVHKQMSATYFPPDESKGPNRDVVTSELIYYWMIDNNIPFDPCEKWHLNRLLALIRVCALKNQDPKKRRMSMAEVMRRNSKLNEERLKKYNTKG